MLSISLYDSTIMRPRTQVFAWMTNHHLVKGCSPPLWKNVAFGRGLRCRFVLSLMFYQYVFVPHFCYFKKTQENKGCCLILPEWINNFCPKWGGEGSVGETFPSPTSKANYYGDYRECWNNNPLLYYLEFILDKCNFVWPIKQWNQSLNTTTFVTNIQDHY